MRTATVSVEQDRSATPATARSALASGSRLGPYELLVPIASGGMGHVWAAVRIGDFGFRRMVAVKVMREELAANAEFRRMFLDEARLASRVLHTNVVEVLDLGEANGTTFQAMTFVDGDSLASLLGTVRDKRLAFPPDAAVRVVCDALRGLHAAHELRGGRGELLELVHRDVSPHNILVGLDGTAKITDFGIAKAFGAWTAREGPGARGKVAYMAPEQRRGEALDRRADVFAMGVVLWELLTGFVASQRADTPPNQRAPGQPEPPPRLWTVMSRALRESPDERFATAEDMADALERAAQASGYVLSSKSVAAWAGRLSRARVLARKDDVMQQLARSNDGATRLLAATMVLPRAQTSVRRFSKRAVVVTAFIVAAAAATTALVRRGEPRAGAAPAAAPPTEKIVAEQTDVLAPSDDSARAPSDDSTPAPVAARSAAPPAKRRPAAVRSPRAAASTAPTAPTLPGPKYDNPY